MNLLYIMIAEMCLQDYQVRKTNIHVIGHEIKNVNKRFTASFENISIKYLYSHHLGAQKEEGEGKRKGERENQVFHTRHIGIHAACILRPYSAILHIEARRVYVRTL